MARRIPGSLKLVLTVLVCLAPLAAGATDQDIATLRVTSIDAVVADLETLAVTLGVPVDGDEVLDGAMAPLQLPGLDLIDRLRPAAMVFPARGLAVGAHALAAVLPVSDVEAALLLLEERFDTHGVNESIHTFSRSDGTSLVVRAEEDYLVLGLDPAVVGSIDLAAALGGAGLPPGNISLDIYLEGVAPVVQAGLLQGRQMVQVQMEAQAAKKQEAMEEAAEEPGESEPEVEGGVESLGEEGDEEDAEMEVTVEPEMDPQAIMPMLDLYFDFLGDVVDNISRVQISIEVTGKHVLLHKWVSPRAGSTLAGLVAAQSGGFPDLARTVRAEGAFVAVAGQIRRTPEFDEALAGFIGRYVEVMKALMAALPDEPLAEQYAALMESMLPTIEQSLGCYRGDVAGVASVDLQGGFRVAQVAGTADAEVCRGFLNKVVELMNSVPAGPGGERMFTATENALTYGGASAVRQETAMLTGLIEAQEGEEAAEFLRGFLGGDSLVSYYGLANDVLVTTMGADAEQAFTEMVARIGDGAVGGGLDPSFFEPLAPGPGFFLMMDFKALAPMIAAMAGSEEEAAEAERIGAGMGRIVFGGRFSGTGLELGAAVPMETLAYWGEKISAAAAEEEVEECEEESAEEPEPFDGDLDEEEPEISEE